MVRKELPATKILILSGYDEFEYAKEAIKLQVAEYLLKPISSAKLLDVLAQVKEVIRQEQEEKEKALQEEEAAGSQEDTAQKGVSDSNG